MMIFLKENNDILEFPIKKFMSIIKDKIENNIKEGTNTFYFNFRNEMTLPITFNLIITYKNSSTITYSAKIDKEELRTKYFNNFDINVKLYDNEIDYNQLYSIVNHELKHVYDIFYDENIDSIEKVTSYNQLKKKYVKNKYILDFIELSNLALSHELDARNRMIYDKLRWLKTYDNLQLEEEFKKTYVYKSLIMLKEFNSKQIINNINLYTLLDFTNEFIEKFIKSNKKVKNKTDLVIFYKEQENIFKKISDEYLLKSYDIIIELIRDKKPYMENKLFIIEDSYYEGIDDKKYLNYENGINSLIKEIWK